MGDKNENEMTTVNMAVYKTHDLSTPEQLNNGSNTFLATIPIKELWKLCEGRTRTRRCAVHFMIRNTLETIPEYLDQKIPSINVVCDSFSFNDSSICATNTVLVSGGESLDEIEGFINDHTIGLHNDGLSKGLLTDMDVHVSVLFFVNTHVSRHLPHYNSKSGWLLDLQSALKTVVDEPRLRSSIHDHRPVTEPDHLLQLIRLLMPCDLESGNNVNPYLKVFIDRGQCMADFIRWRSEIRFMDSSKIRYAFYLSMAAQALSLYRDWLNQDEWLSCEFSDQIHSSGSIVHLGDNGTIKWIAQGIINPIMRAMSVFVCLSDGVWSIKTPDSFSSSKMIKLAMGMLESNGNDPIAMGRDPEAYEILLHYTNSCSKVVESV